MPPRDLQLRGQDRGANLVAVLADFSEVAALGFRKRSRSPVVDHQNVDAAKPRQQNGQAVICPCHREVAEERTGVAV